MCAKREASAFVSGRGDGDDFKIRRKWGVCREFMVIDIIVINPNFVLLYTYQREHII